MMTTENPLVSVIIPCYNQGRFLPETLNSVRSQSYTSWECLIINDGSTDETEKIALEWQANDSRIKYFAKKNGGLSSARNMGLSHAQGDYIQFLDADDAIHPEKFKLQLESINPSSRYAISYCDYFASTEKNLNEPVRKYLSPIFKTKNYVFELINRWEKSLSIPCHCFLFSTNMVTENTIRFDETIKNHEDWDFWMNLFRQRPMVSFIPKELAIYRVHSSSMSRNYKEMKIGFIKSIKKQRKNFSVFSIEYLLLTSKYFNVMLRINRQNIIVRFIIDQIKLFLKK